MASRAGGILGFILMSRAVFCLRTPGARGYSAPQRENFADGPARSAADFIAGLGEGLAAQLVRDRPQDAGGNRAGEPIAQAVVGPRDAVHAVEVVVDHGRGLVLLLHRPD